jgi:hypothetical protein
MSCDCRQRLRDEAARLFVEADRLRLDRRTRHNADNTQARANALGAAAGFLNKHPGGDMTHILRGPADADHYRVKVGRFRERWYVDPLPADSIADATDGQWPSVSSVKKASGSDWSFVALKRVALALDENPEELVGLPYDARYERLKTINKLGLERAAARGTQVHTYFERALRGQELATPFDNPTGALYLDAVKAFLDEQQPELVAAELVCINRDLNGVGYGGTADCILRINGGVYKVDWKSRGEDSDHGAYAEEAAQIGGYADADYFIGEGPQRMPMPALDGGLIVSIKPDGYRLFPVDLDKAVKQWRALHAWWVARRTEHEPVGKPWAPVAHHPVLPPSTNLLDLIAQATTEAALVALWEQNQGAWSQEHTDLAKVRKATLTASAA